MTETLAEMKVFHIDGDVEGKPLAVGHSQCDRPEIGL